MEAIVQVMKQCRVGKGSCTDRKSQSQTDRWSHRETVAKSDIQTDSWAVVRQTDKQAAASEEIRF
jgi:hypothetical protein